MGTDCIMLRQISWQNMQARTFGIRMRGLQHMTYHLDLRRTSCSIF